MKIKSIYIDGLHNAVNKTYTFGDINYIFGNNGIGKSTILQAIQLALLGYIPGTAKNSKEALLRHSPKGKIEVTISLTDTENDSDIIVNRRITAKTTEVNTIPGNVYISDIIQNIELPIFNFNEFVGQTANKLKEYFIKNILPTADGELDWNKILTDAISDSNFSDKDKIVQYGLSLIQGAITSEPDILNQVVVANSLFKEDQSFKKTELQRLQNTIDSMIYYDDYMGPTDILALNAQILEAGSLRDQLIQYNAAVSATKAIDTELIALKQRIEDFGGRAAYDDICEKLPKVNSEITRISAAMGAEQSKLADLQIQETANTKILSGNGVCPYTKNSCEAIEGQLTQIRQENEAIKSRKAMCTADIEKYTAELANFNSKVRGYKADIQNFKNIWERIKSLEGALQEIPAKPKTDKDIFTLDQEIAALTQSKEKLQANIKYNETIESITKLKYETELQLTALNKWAKITDTNGLQTTLMEAPFNELSDTLTNLIRAMYGDNFIKAHFNITNKANSFSFGLIRDGVYIPYDLLSSGEKCLYALALMICITNTDKSPLKLLLCDDMFDHLDNTVIENTFDSLKAYNRILGHDIQFIFAGVKECQNARDILITV